MPIDAYASPSSSGSHWYVYYRIDAAALPQAVAAVRTFQRRLMLDLPGLQADVLKRPSSDPAQLTLMETYCWQAGTATPPEPAALTARVDAAATALQPLLAGPRRWEVFEPCA